MASKYPGLLVSQGDKEQALYKGLLDMGANMTRGYTDKPTSFAQQVGQGGAAFGTGYQDRINQSKQDQMGDMKYKFQQAQMESERMKIEQAKLAQAEAARVKLIEDRMLNTQQFGGFVPGSMDAANFQSTLSPEQQMLNVLDPIGQAKAGIAASAASAAEQRKSEQEEKIARIKANGKGALTAKDRLQLGNNRYDKFVKDNADNLGRMEGYQGLEAVYTDPSGTSAYQSIAANGQATINGTIFQASDQGAKDMALIFSVMKMLDPGSTVREGEFNLAANSSGAAKAAMNFVNKVWSGDQLPPEARQQMMALARGQYDAAKTAVDANLVKAKGRMSSRMPGVNPDQEFMGAVPDYMPKFGANAFDPNLFKKITKKPLSSKPITGGAGKTWTPVKPKGGTI